MWVHTHIVSMGVCVTEWHSISTHDGIKLRIGSSNWKIENRYFIGLPLKVLPWELRGDLQCCQLLWFYYESYDSWLFSWRSSSWIPVIYFLFIFWFGKLDSNSNPPVYSQSFKTWLKCTLRVQAAMANKGEPSSWFLVGFWGFFFSFLYFHDHSG